MQETRKNNKKALGEKLSGLFDFDFSITRERIFAILPFIFYVALLIILYISNKYYSEKSYLKENNLKKELKDLRAEMLTIQAELINKTKQSDVIERAKELGLEEIKTPPPKIIIKKDEY